MPDKTLRFNSFLFRLLNKPLLQATLVALLGIAAYANSLHAPFELDDNRQMLDLPYVQSLKYLADWPLLRHFAVDHDFRLRFVGYLSFALNYAVHDTSVTGYHLVNVAIHLGNALLVYALVRHTFRTPFFALQGARCEPQETLGARAGWNTETANATAWLTALLFVAHPVQTGAVTYVVQRLTSLTTLFYLAALFFYLRARLPSPGRGPKARALFGHCATLGCAILAMKTKEIAFTLPLAVCLYEFMFFVGSPGRRAARLVPLFLTMLIIPAALLTAPGSGEGAMRQLASVSRAASVLPRYDYLVTELRVMVTYLRLLVLPVQQNLLYDFPLFHSLLAPQVLLSLALLAALFFLALYLWRRSQLLPGAPVAGLQRVVAFGIFWFFLTLAVESSLIPIRDVIFEHRLYLPSVGAFAALAASLALAARRLSAAHPRSGNVIAVVAAAAVLALAGATFARNGVWSSEESLWRDVVGKSPEKPLGYQYLGLALMEKGDIVNAFASFDRSLALDPELAEGYSNRGTLYAQVGRYREAEADLTRSISLNPGYIEPMSNLGLVYLELGDPEKAITVLARAVSLDPDNVKANNNLGLALARTGRPLEAISHYDRAIALLPTYGKAFFNRGMARAETGRLSLAVTDLSRAITLDPSFSEAYVQRGGTFARWGKREEAIADFRTACEMNNQEGCRQLRALTAN